MENRKEEQQGAAVGWMTVPAFGEWDVKNGAVPDYSMDFSKIREMRKQNKRELSRASLGGDEDLLQQQQQHHHHQQSNKPQPPKSSSAAVADDDHRRSLHDDSPTSVFSHLSRSRLISHLVPKSGCSSIAGRGTEVTKKEGRSS